MPRRKRMTVTPPAMSQDCIAEERSAKDHDRGVAVASRVAKDRIFTRPDQPPGEVEHGVDAGDEGWTVHGKAAFWRDAWIVMMARSVKFGIVAIHAVGICGGAVADRMRGLSSLASRVGQSEPVGGWRADC